MYLLDGWVGLRRSIRCLTLGVAVILAVGFLAARAMPSRAADKIDPGPDTGLCTDQSCGLDEGSDDQGPDDPNIYSWDGANSASDSTLEGAGFTCGYGTSPGAPLPPRGLDQTQYGCWNSNSLYTCTRHWILFIPWGYDCVKKY